MSINLKRTMAGVVCFMIWGASALHVMAQETPVPRTQTPAVIKYNGDMANLLAHLTDTYNVTIGLEVDPQQPWSRISLYLRDPTLADVLNAIVHSAPGYKWRESDGFVEVLPVKWSHSLLETIINNFQVSDVNRAEAINQLMNLPEVQDRMTALNLKLRNPVSAKPKLEDKKFSLNLQGVTMRQALSTFASESGGRFWIFRASPDGWFSIGHSPR